MRRETGISALDAEQVVHRAVRRAGLEAQRYLDDPDLESLLCGCKYDVLTMVQRLHFASPDTWEAAEKLLAFRPVAPTWTAGFPLEGLRVHTHDHKQRELSRAARTLEAHYGGFVLSELTTTPEVARRSALEVMYGSVGLETQIAGHEARSYEAGPEPEPDDPDGRMPAVVTWADGEMFFLLASGELSTETLTSIGASMYGQR